MPLLAGWGARWVERQRAAHRPVARALTSPARDILAPFFLPKTLAAARMREVARLDPPRSAVALRRLGLPLPLEFDRLWGITFVDTVVILDRVPEAARPALLFHELVHVVQYRLLGAKGFVARYLSEWAEAGFRYQAIGLERDAYALAERFARVPEDAFAAEAEIAQRLAAAGRREVAAASG